MEYFKKLSGGTQGPPKQLLASGLEAMTVPLAFSHELLLHLPRRCGLLRAGLSQGKTWHLGQCRS